MACLAALLVAVRAVQRWLVDPGTGVAVCLTPKVANSDITDYVRWTRSSSAWSSKKGACKWSPDHVKDYERTCEGQDELKKARLAGGDPPPLQSCRYTRFRQPNCSLLDQHRGRGQGWQLLVPLRDPYTKLLSSFHSKIEVGLGGELYFIHFPTFSLLNSSEGNVLERFFDAVTREAAQSAQSGGHFNWHFQTQAEQCLSPAMDKWAKSHGRSGLVPLPLDQHDGLDALSAAFGVPANSSRSFSQLMQGSYKYYDACLTVAPKLVRRVASFLAPSYSQLRRVVGIVYPSETAIDRAARSREVRMCTATYNLYARNSSSEWTPLRTSHHPGVAAPPGYPNPFGRRPPSPSPPAPPSPPPPPPPSPSPPPPHDPARRSVPTDTDHDE